MYLQVFSHCNRSCWTSVTDLQSTAVQVSVCLRWTSVFTQDSYLCSVMKGPEKSVNSEILKDHFYVENIFVKLQD